jgi:hypothetical protein
MGSKEGRSNTKMEKVEEFHNLCSSSNIIRQIKSWRIKWAGHVAHKVLVGSQRERGHLEDRVVDGRIGSEWILGRLAGRV